MVYILTPPSEPLNLCKLWIFIKWVCSLLSPLEYEKCVGCASPPEKLGVPFNKQVLNGSSRSISDTVPLSNLACRRISKSASTVLAEDHQSVFAWATEAAVVQLCVSVRVLTRACVRRAVWRSGCGYESWLRWVCVACVPYFLWSSGP